MDVVAVTIFLIVYTGMILGGLPFLQLDRTGIALLGAIATIAVGGVSLDEAWGAVHAPTLILLFSFMVMSAQLRLGGFYTWVTRRLGAAPLGPLGFLAAFIVVIAFLSAVFSNDIVCLAVAPVLIEVCRVRRLDPLPFLLALACAANVGSAATLIGNPQNMLIGEKLAVSFAGYMRDALIPVVLGLAVTWAVIGWGARGKWYSGAGPGARDLPGEAAPPFDAWQSAKGLGTATVVFVLFLFAPLPREVVALTAAGLLMLSRKLHSYKMLGLVDWQILVLFIGLFVVNHAFSRTGVPQDVIAGLAANGVDLSHPAPLAAVAFVLSNLVSNVPAVMLLLPAATHDLAGPVLALSSTLAGNLLIVGSIANIIVVGAAQRHGVAVGWREHARVGIPVTLATLFIMAGYFAVRMGG